MKIVKKSFLGTPDDYDNIVMGKVYRTDGGAGVDAGDDGRLYLATDEGVADIEDGTFYHQSDSGCDTWLYWEVQGVELVVPSQE